MRNTFGFLLLAITTTVVFGQEKPFAQGNLAIILKPKNAVVSTSHAIEGGFTVPYLWCQATTGDDSRLKIKKAQFRRGYAPFVFNATVDEDDRAYLRFGAPKLQDAGKYRCEITTEEYGLVWGNLFVYMRPVFYTNGSTRLEVGDDPFIITGSAAKFSDGDTAVLHCPVFAYPQADIEWYKDGESIDFDSGHFEQRNEYLYIHDVSKEDEGSYRCTATNRFPVDHKDNEQVFTSVLEQSLKISDALSWLIPLIVIIVILILLVIIIYACAYCNRRKSDQYDVQKREKSIRQAEEQRLRDEEEE